jgi:hypothetical protein
MSGQDRSAGAAASTSGGSAVVVIGVIALVLNLAVTALSVAGYRLFIPFNILGGFSFNLGVLPVVTALIIAFALWRYGGLSQGKAWLAALFLFVVPVVVSFAMNYLTGKLLANLSNAAVTNSQNFYFILFLKSAASAASVLLVLAIAAAPFRAWPVWLALIVVWAGGDVLLFALYSHSMFTRDVYQWLYPLERTLGFIVIAYQLQRPARAVR